MDKKRKKKLEFSKLLVIVAITIFAGYGIYSGMRYYSLVLLAIESENSAAVMPDPSLAVTCVGGILGSILTYVLYQGSLKLSLNANNLSIDEVTGIVSKVASGDVQGALEDIVVNDKRLAEQKKSKKKAE